MCTVCVSVILAVCTTNGPGFCDIALEILCRFSVLSIFREKKKKKQHKMLLHKVCHIHFFKLVLSRTLPHPSSIFSCVYPIPLLLLFEYRAVVVVVVVVVAAVVCFCSFIQSFIQCCCIQNPL